MKGDEPDGQRLLNSEERRLTRTPGRRPKSRHWGLHQVSSRDTLVRRQAAMEMEAYPFPNSYHPSPGLS